MKRYLDLRQMTSSIFSMKSRMVWDLSTVLLSVSLSIGQGQASVTLSDALNSTSQNQTTMGDQTNLNDQTTSQEKDFDHYESFNRAVFEFNQVFNDYILDPIVNVYQTLLPDSTQECVHSFLSNLSSPLIFLNDVAQLEGDRAMDTLARFLLNTTLGLGGLFDPAQEVFSINYHYEDFGLTLGTYGIEKSSYLVLPFLGPSNVRDTLGLGVDFLIDPVRYATRHRKSLNYVRYGSDTIDKRVQADKVLKQVNAALDPYTFMRTLYQQNRQFAVKKGVTQLESPTPSDE